MREYDISVSRDIKYSRNIEIDMRECHFYKTTDFDNDKQYVKFIKSIESLVRTSLEYRDYISFLKETVDMNRCALYKNLDRSILPVSIEIHHAPFTLFDITAIMCQRYFDQYGYYNKLAIANGIMKLHYKGWVGLIPLSKTVHKLVHRGDVFLPVYDVFGDWEMFHHLYKEWFTDDQKESISFKKQLTHKIDTGQIEWSCPVLDEELVFLDLKGVDYNLEPMDLFIKEQIKVDGNDGLGVA